jgi:pyruvate/2-oxoglutarate/acetoin dehydrogenase E1 component
MTWNFALLALDQVVNSAAKMLYMSGGQYPMPIVFRGPNGAALQLGAQHSQAWESWLAHIPGLKVVCHGKMALVGMQAADALAKDGIRVDVVDLRTIRPMDVEAIYASVRKTNRAVVLEEGWELCGVGAQVADYIQRECFDDLDAPVLRVHQADVPMPYAKSLEKAAKPDAAKAIAAVRRVMYLDER